MSRDAWRKADNYLEKYGLLRGKTGKGRSRGGGKIGYVNRRITSPGEKLSLSTFTRVGHGKKRKSSSHRQEKERQNDQ